MSLYNLLPNAIRYLVASSLWTPPPPASQRTPLRFELRHEHALSPSTARNVFSNVESHDAFARNALEIDTAGVTVHRPRSHAAFTGARFRGDDLDWDAVELQGPGVRDRETLLLLAKMTSNAYTEPTSKDWYDMGPEWNNSYPFGWEPDADGFRGHIFATADNSTVVVSVKGTSAVWPIGGGGPTQHKDKLNDNLLFSCCCARVGPTWSTVCGCYEGGNRCDQSCLETSLAADSLFYGVGINLYNNVTYMYPDANIWMIGHSLGGALASLIGLTFGAPVVAFEAPAERMAATRLHLPKPPSTHHITHVYNTGDPIPQGACTGVASTCAAIGYALESRCHLGRVLRYDTVGKLRWSVNVVNHGIKALIDGVLAKPELDWRAEGEDEARSVPAFTDESDCVDCFNWEFGDYRNSSMRGCA